MIGVARASLEELLLDCEDYLRTNGLEKWPKDHPKAVFIRKLAYAKNKSYKTYRTYSEDETPETAGNTVICLINQANFLLDRQLKQLEKQFLEEGGFTERLYRARRRAREE